MDKRRTPSLMMKYLILVFSLTLKRIWARVLTITGIVSLFFSAIFEESQPAQTVALIAIMISFAIMLGRLILSPYWIWQEDQKKIQGLESRDNKNNNPRLKLLFQSSASMFTAMKDIHLSYMSADESNKDAMLKIFTGSRDRVSDNSNHFLHDDALYVAAQDSINRCEIAVYDCIKSGPNRNNFSEAQKYVKKLQSIISTRGNI